MPSADREILLKQWRVGQAASYASGRARRIG